MRLIDADELLKYANGQITSAFAYPQGQRADEEKAYREMWLDIRKILLSAPTIEAVPIKYGADDGLIFKDTARRIIDSPRSKSQMLSVLKSLPTIEAEPVKHGRWKFTFRGMRAVPVDADITCSVCGATFNRTHGTRFLRCPNCGADMREVEE